MKAATIVLCLAASASAFVPPTSGKAVKTTAEARPEYNDDGSWAWGFGDSASYTPGAAEKMEGSSPPWGFWDPLNLGDVDSTTLAWYKHAELKHSRVAMAAFVGWLVNAQGIHFPGSIDFQGHKFADLGNSPLEAWDNMPLGGKYQIIGTLGVFELMSEIEKPHYTRGGTPGKVSLNGIKLWDPMNTLSKADDATKARKRQVEVNNGRLAMIGIMGFVASSTVKGSIPAIDLFKGYAGGLPTAPFLTNYDLFAQ